MSKEPKKKKVKSKKVIKKIKITGGEIYNLSSIENKFLLVRVGNNDDPATGPQIKEIEDKLVDFFKKNNINCFTFVTHHYVDINVY